MSQRWHEVHAQLLNQTARKPFNAGYSQIRHRYSELGRFRTPGDLISYFHDVNACGLEKNRALRALIEAAQVQDDRNAIASTLVTLALWPGLDAVRGRLSRHFRNDPDLLVGELTGRLAQGIGQLDLQRVNRIAATLLRNIERDIKRALIREQDRGECALDEERMRQSAEQSLLTRGVRPKLRKVLGDDADLVVAVVLFGFSQKEAAGALGLSHDVARKRYQRAMAKLARIAGEP